MKLKKAVIIICSFILIGSVTVYAGAAQTVSSECSVEDMELPLEVTQTSAIGDQLEINAKSAFLIEPLTGQILYESNADEPLAPASITKIMSLLLIVEAIDHGSISTLCKEIYNPDILQKDMLCSRFQLKMSGLLFI